MTLIPWKGLSFAVISASTVAVSASWAQQAPRTLPPAPRVAGIAPAPAAPPQAGASGGKSSSVSTLSPGTIVGAGVVPVIVTADGRVFADFGSGYEQIVRPCVASGLVPANAPIGTMPVYPLPVYGTGSSTVTSQGVVSSTTSSVSTTKTASPAVSQSAQARAACWSPDQLGRIVVVR